jgi:hypothetical protein
MAEMTATLLKHRKRLREVAEVLARHGLAAWAARGAGLAGISPVDKLLHHEVRAEDIGASSGERLGSALAELERPGSSSGRC